jgi:hypothetical protein
MIKKLYLSGSLALPIALYLFLSDPTVALKVGDCPLTGTRVFSLWDGLNYYLWNSFDNTVHEMYGGSSAFEHGETWAQALL